MKSTHTHTHWVRHTSPPLWMCLTLWSGQTSVWLSVWRHITDLSMTKKSPENGNIQQRGIHDLSFAKNNLPSSGETSAGRVRTLWFTLVILWRTIEETHHQRGREREGGEEESVCVHLSVWVGCGVCVCGNGVWVCGCGVWCGLWGVCECVCAWVCEWGGVWCVCGGVWVGVGCVWGVGVRMWGVCVWCVCVVMSVCVGCDGVWWCGCGCVCMSVVWCWGVVCVCAGECDVCCVCVCGEWVCCVVCVHEIVWCVCVCECECVCVCVLCECEWGLCFVCGVWLCVCVCMCVWVCVCVCVCGRLLWSRALEWVFDLVTESYTQQDEGCETEVLERKFPCSVLLLPLLLLRCFFLNNTQKEAIWAVAGVSGCCYGGSYSILIQFWVAAR